MFSVVAPLTSMIAPDNFQLFKT